MKKLFCIFLAFVMMFSFNVFASAESDLTTKLEGLDVTIPLPDAPEHEKHMMDRSEIASTTDTVVMTDTSFEVRTADGILLTYTYPTENVMCLSQDLAQQTYYYLMFYPSNMTGMAAQFVEMGMHLNVFDIETQSDVYFYISDSPLGQALQNLSSLSEADVDLITQMLADGSFKDAKSVVSGMIGNNLWIFADYESIGYLLTYVNGKEVFGEVNYGPESGPAEALALLNTLTISAA